jgi:hypothetical protein
VTRVRKTAILEKKKIISHSYPISFLDARALVTGDRDTVTEERGIRNNYFRKCTTEQLRLRQQKEISIIIPVTYFLEIQEVELIG